MTGHADVLDQYDSLRKPFAWAVTLHAVLVGASVAYVWLGRANPFGDKNAGGAAVGIEAVNSIPLPRTHGEENPVANDTKSEVQQEPAKQERVKQEPVPTGSIPTKSKAKPKKTAEVASVPSKYRPFDEIDPNRVHSTQAPALSNPMYNLPGAGQIGIGENTTLGSGFGAYGAQLRQLVAQSWHPADAIPANVRSAPRVTATFELNRDGSVHDVKIKQGSGISTLDYSVQRAILDAKLPPFPRGLDKSSATVEFLFELNR